MLLPLIGLLTLYGFSSSCISPPQPPSQPLSSGPAVNELLTRAQGGEAEAQNQLGIHYSEGQGLPQNYQEAKY